MSDETVVHSEKFKEYLATWFPCEKPCDSLLLCNNCDDARLLRVGYGFAFGDLQSELTRLRAENERLIGVVDIEVERKAALMAENEQIKKYSVENYLKSADVWEKERDSLRTQLAKAKECLEFYGDLHWELCEKSVPTDVEEVPFDEKDIAGWAKKKCAKRDEAKLRAVCTCNLGKRARKTLEEITSRQTLSEIDNLNRKST